MCKAIAPYARSAVELRPHNPKPKPTPNPNPNPTLTPAITLFPARTRYVYCTFFTLAGGSVTFDPRVLRAAMVRVRVRVRVS